MSISARQFNHLQEMGINVYQRKHLSVAEEIVEDKLEDNEASVKAADMDLSQQEQSSQVQEQAKAQPQNSKASEHINATSNTIEIPSIEQLTTSQLFKDVLVHLSLSIGEISRTDDHLNLGFINWRLANTDRPAANENETISLQSGLLTTPSIEQIAASVELKRRLWSTLQSSVLTND